MNELWHIETENGESIILTDFDQVVIYEKEFRDEGVRYGTDYYKDNVLINKSLRKTWK